MGDVVSIREWLAVRDVGPDCQPGDVARLERAVSRLEPLLEEVNGGTRKPGIDVETELLAATGAVSLDLFEEAAGRLERLADRLTALARRGG
jgi:hypothetical protein